MYQGTTGNIISIFPPLVLLEVSQYGGYKSISEMHKALKNNHSYITTRLRGIQYGDLGGIISDASYGIIVVGTMFMELVGPGLSPVFVMGVTSLIQ